jgi:hypothetical protein
MKKHNLPGEERNSGMAIKIKTQRDYLVTEVSIELPTDLSALDYLMRTSRGSGRIIALYGEGGVQGVSIEQRSKIPESVSDEVRKLVGVETKEMNGN